MTPLPLQFHRSTFIYRQVCRFGDVALYRKRPAFADGDEKLEVARVRKSIAWDMVTHQMIPSVCQESYPLPGDYGKHLFSVEDDAEAFGLMAALLLT